MFSGPDQPWCVSDAKLQPFKFRLISGVACQGLFFLECSTPTFACQLCVTTQTSAQPFCSFHSQLLNIWQTPWENGREHVLLFSTFFLSGNLAPQICLPLCLSNASKHFLIPIFKFLTGRMLCYCYLVIARRGLHPSQGFCDTNMRNVICLREYCSVGVQ